MIQRLFLNGIDLQCGGRSVAQAIQRAALIDSNKAKPSLSRIDMTMPRAKVAVRAPVSLSLPPAGRVQRFCLLEDLQVVHGPLFSQRGQYTLRRSVRSARRRMPTPTPALF